MHDIAAAARRFNAGVVEFNATVARSFAPVVRSVVQGMHDLDAAMLMARRRQHERDLERLRRTAAMQQRSRRKGRRK